MVSPQVLMMAAGTSILDTGVPPTCPLCEQSPLRFYCHVFRQEQEQGTIWVWCPRCKGTTHVSRMTITWQLQDPYRDLDLRSFAKLERSRWLERLDELWEAKKIPHTLGSRDASD